MEHDAFNSGPGRLLRRAAIRFHIRVRVWMRSIDEVDRVLREFKDMCDAAETIEAARSVLREAEIHDLIMHYKYSCPPLLRYYPG